MWGCLSVIVSGAVSAAMARKISLLGFFVALFAAIPTETEIGITVLAV